MTWLLLLFFAAQCACKPQVVDAEKLIEQARLQAERLQRDSEFVDFVFDEIARIERGAAPAGPRQIEASSEIVWCADSHLCPHGYTVMWDPNVGFGVLKYEQRGDELGAECMQKQEKLKRLRLSIDCESE